MKVKSLSRVRLLATPWTAAYQAPPPMGFPRKEYWSGLPFPSPGDLPDSGIEPRSPTLQADALTSEPPGMSEECVISLVLSHCSKDFETVGQCYSWFTAQFYLPSKGKYTLEA